MATLLHNIKKTFSNIAYITKIIWETRKRLIFYSIFFIITETLSMLPIIIISKFIIDEITTFRRANVVISWAILLVILDLLIKNLRIFTKNFVSLNSKYMMIPMSILFNEKNMKMDFECTEDPQVLDEKQKASLMLLNPGSEENSGNIEYYIMAINECVVGILQFILTFLLISTFNIYFVLLLFVISLIKTLFGIKIKKANYGLHLGTASLQRKWNYLTDIACNFIFGKTVRIFKLSEWLSKKGTENISDRMKIFRKITNNTTRLNISNEAINILQQLISYGCLAFNVLKNNMSIGNFTMYLNSVTQFSATFDKISTNALEITKNDIAISNYRHFITKEGNMQKTAVAGLKIKDGISHTIKFDNVSFKYPRQEKYTLKNVSLEINAGEKLSIVGENGAGKTTFIKLLLRLYDVNEGKILIDGIDIRKYAYTDYLTMFSTVFQDFKTYAFTVYENISLSQTENTTEGELDKVLQMGGLMEKISRLKNGGSTYMTREFEEEGVELSGGEQQKLALCRALFKDAPIVVLDEPTASLSPLAEHDIYSKFNEMVKNKTAIFISHRLSSSVFCDKIAMFSNGQIIEYGTHQELMSMNGSYSEMFRLQSKYYVQEEAVL